MQERQLEKVSSLASKNFKPEKEQEEEQSMRITILLMSLTVFLSQSVWAGEQENKAFRDQVNKRIKEKCSQQTADERFSCWQENSPEKCQGFVIARDTAEWSRCVQSCGSASWFSKTFGECSI